MKKLSTLAVLLAFQIFAQAQNQSSHNYTDSAMKYSILVMYKVMPGFLNMKREERNRFFEEEIGPIIHKFADHVAIRMFDSEAFHAKVSDFLIVECAELQDYYFFMEHLRDTKLFGEPYIELQDVVIGIEGGFQSFEASH